MRALLGILPFLLLVPTAQASTVNATITTGEVHLYNDDTGGQVCADVLTDWRVKLILEPGTGPDIVVLSVQGQTAGADATAPGKDTAIVYVTTTNGCEPLTEVTGAFVGSEEVRYTLEWAWGGLPFPL